MLCSTFRRDWRKLRWYVYRNVIIYLYVIVCYKEYRNFCNSNRISLFSDALISFKFNHWMTLNVHKLPQDTALFSEAMISFKFNHCMTLTVHNIGIISCKTQDEDKQSNNKHRKQKDDPCWSLLQKGE